MTYILAALMLGCLSSLHCIGMCGPIALALPVKSPTLGARLYSSLFYNTGRIFIYACLGLIFGTVGKGFALAGWQNILSVFIGTVMLFCLLLPDFLRQFSKRNFFYSPVSKVKGAVLRLFKKSNPFALLLIGMLNGLLPCGLVYLAITGSVLTGSAVKGVIFMAVFGLGTWPAMFCLSLLGQYLSIKIRNAFRKLSPYFIGIVAFLLILRGLNLGIPYLSPKITTDINGISTHACCHK